MIYDNITPNHNNILDIKNRVLISYVRGPRIEILGNQVRTYKVQFIDKRLNEIRFETTINNNCWAKCNIEYFVDWKVVVWEGDKIYHEEEFNAEGKRVYIALDSRALGDTLAWVGYGEEFSKQHKCKVILSTFHNQMFEKEY